MNTYSKNRPIWWNEAHAQAESSLTDQWQRAHEIPGVSGFSLADLYLSGYAERRVEICENGAGAGSHVSYRKPQMLCDAL